MRHYRHEKYLDLATLATVAMGMKKPLILHKKAPIRLLRLSPLVFLN